MSMERSCSSGRCFLVPPCSDWVTDSFDQGIIVYLALPWYACSVSVTHPDCYIFRKWKSRMWRMQQNPIHVLNAVKATHRMATWLSTCSSTLGNSVITVDSVKKASMLKPTIKDTWINIRDCVLFVIFVLHSSLLRFLEIIMSRRSITGSDKGLIIEAFWIETLKLVCS